MMADYEINHFSVFGTDLHAFEDSGRHVRAVLRMTRYRLSFADVVQKQYEIEQSGFCRVVESG